MTIRRTVTPNPEPIFASGLWYVPSRSAADQRYEVTQHGHNEWACECAFSAFASVRGGRCWHVNAVRKAAARRLWIHGKLTDAQVAANGYRPFSAYQLLPEDCDRCGTPLMTTTAPTGPHHDAKRWVVCVARGCGYREVVQAEQGAAMAVAS